MSNLFYAGLYTCFIGFLPLFYTFFRSLKQADLKNKQFYILFFKDVVRTLPICALVFLPVAIFPELLRGYMLFLHIVFMPFVFLELGHIYFFKTRIGLNTFFTLFVSNIKETKEFLSQNIPVFLYVVSFLFFVCPLILLLQLETVSLGIVERVLFSLSLFIIGLPFLLNLRKKGFKFKDGYVLNPFSNVIFHYFLYKKTYAELKNHLAQSKAKPFENILKDVSHDEKETYVIIIGESANRTHLGVYGYGRDTTPFSARNKNDWLVFKNVVSPFAQTMPVLERVLTFADAKNPEFLLEKGTIVDYFNQAGFKTYWLSNQYALSDTLVTAISSHASWEKSYNFSGMKRFEKTGFDGDMLDDIEHILKDDSAHKKVVFIHLIGSHSAYTNRYPADWVCFKDKMEGKNLSNEGHVLLNAYDDSIRYTDYVVNQIMERVKALNDLSYCLYFSDHGEDIFDTTSKKILGHSELANEPMVSVPFMLYVSELFKQKRQHDFKMLEQNEMLPYNTEHVIHTILHLAGLNNEDIKVENSLCKH